MDNEARFFISVVIPVHNRVEALERAIRSVLAQTHSAFELRVVDDASEADIEGLCRSFGDPRIHYHRLPEKGNANLARNKGIREAQGDYVALLDSDDEWYPGHLERKLDRIQESRADGVFGSAMMFNGVEERKFLSRPKKEGEDMLAYYLNGGLAPAPTFFFKREAIAEVLFDEKLHRNQDLDLAIRFSRPFRFEADQAVTVLIHWEGSGEGKQHIPSNIRFLQRYKEDMPSKGFVDFAIKLSGKVKREVDYQDLYKLLHKEFVQRIAHVSLTDYLSLVRPKNGMKKLFLRLRYLCYVLFS